MLTTAASAARHAAKRLGVKGEGNDRVQAGAMVSVSDERLDEDTFEDPHKPPPSAVVHVRGLLDTALESDLVEAVQHFGLVSYVVMMPKTRQALVEFEDPESSRSCVDYSSTGSVYVCGQPAYFNFSTSQKLWRPGVPGDNGNSNHVLLFTILNPITTDVLYNICKPFGPLQRIVIFRKNGLQAFVEFVSVESAERANSSLNGADIYSGCCTLIVDYARATRLNVFKNDSETWDFTNPGLKQEGNAVMPAKQTSLLGEHPKAHACGGGDCGGHQQPSPPGVDYGSGGDGMGMGGGGGMGMGGMGNLGGTQGQHVQAMMNQQADNKVLIVYDLDAERFNCDRVFNILCLFGDVEKRVEAAVDCAGPGVRAAGRHRQLQGLRRFSQPPLCRQREGGEEPQPASHRGAALLQRAHGHHGRDVRAGPCPRRPFSLLPAAQKGSAFGFFKSFPR
ncbi:heterogeneous nuclear ribonucleoprotein L-like isoform X3 [Petromyzon marinus]